MKPRKTTLLIALVVLLLTAFTVGMGQGTTQTDQKKKAESCCAAEGADSCKDGADCCKKEKEGESCCSGEESCDMNHATGDAAKGDKSKHKHGEGDCCKMKQKDKDKNKTKEKPAA